MPLVRSPHAFVIALALAAVLAGPAAPLVAQTPAASPPPVQREFRGVWVASVSNIDWPSRAGLSTWEQQAELIAILNRAVALRLNAVVLQVRPAADALYSSRYEPWSEYLTGRQGQAPEPYYDPLAFAVAEAHKRGLELHAWFNPFRARHSSASSPAAGTHLSERRPELVRTYGRYLWLDPGEPEVRQHSIRVILDVVRRYDIDGVHIDDYFYPYRVTDSTGLPVDFPDERSWSRYVRAGGELGRDDWRRRNVDMFVRDLYAGIKATKRWVKFGISPFGIWRPGFPEQIRGLDPYEQLYADSKTWLARGWLDYFTPQLYWPDSQLPQSYSVLLRWWVEQNERKRHIWPGNFTSRVRPPDSTGWRATELLEQIRLTRAQPGAGGNVHFSMRALLRDPDSLATRLQAEAYAAPALVPASPWLGSAPPRPSVRVRVDSATRGRVAELRPGGERRPWLWVIRARGDTGWTTAILPGAERLHRLTPDSTAAAPDRVVVTALGRAGVESAPARWGAATGLAR
jgi:uncharacterized lipoprotein YddW (UPF0748 family)